MGDFIRIRNAKEHNLCGVDLDLPKNKLIVVTGLSGSGKSSLAFDTIYAEGQRRYVESLSSYARQFLDLHSKPDVDSITGLSPAISISQKSISKNPRSTVSTITEIYDYLRLMYSRIGVPYSPVTGKPIVKQTVSQIVDSVNQLPPNTKIYVLAPIVRGRKGEHQKEILEVKKQGYARLKIDGFVYEINDQPILDKNQKHDIFVVVDRILITDETNDRVPSSVESALKLGKGLMYIEIVELEKDTLEYTNGQILTFSENFSCPESGFSIEELEPRMFSFNSPYGACPSCDGLGRKVGTDHALVVPNHNLSIVNGAIIPVGKVDPKSLGGNSRPYFERYCADAILAMAKIYNFDISCTWSDLDKKVQEMILFGTGASEITLQRLDHDGKHSVVKAVFPGVINLLSEQSSEQYTNLSTCQDCRGYRLRPQSLLVRVADLHIGELVNLSVNRAKDWFQNLRGKLDIQQRQIAEKIISEIINRLTFLQNVGLDYLSLDRESATLSGGEAQRIRLASQIGSGLTGVLYVLDEPSIGLHQSDNDRLVQTLKNLRDIGNTVIVVEHDEDTIMNADYVVDIGPGAGSKGGRLIACGTPQEILVNKNSITGQYLSGARSITIPKNRRQSSECIEILEACENNLKNVSVKFPLGTLICVTGISGSGKSSLVVDTLYRYIAKKMYGAHHSYGKCKAILGIENIDKIIEIDQSPIGRTPLSNPATYVGLFTHIRTWFAGLPESKTRGYSIGRFSFNAKGGRCEACKGDGAIKIEMHFLPDIYVKCEQCNGLRYNRETLEVTYKSKSIADVLNMTVDQAAEFFENLPLIQEKLASLQDVGMGYIHIGQSSTTLSGGEAQRIKLAKELSKRATGKTLYILDEPTTGLHFEDINNLLQVLHKLTDLGNTVIIIEHNLHLIKTADYIIDVGPGGGASGGRIVASGTPEEITLIPESATGQYLKPYLQALQTNNCI